MNLLDSIEKIGSVPIIYNIYQKIKRSLLSLIILLIFIFVFPKTQGCELITSHTMLIKTLLMCICALLWFIDNHTFYFIKNKSNKKYAILFKIDLSYINEFSFIRSSFYSNIKKYFRKYGIEICFCDHYFSEKLEKFTEEEIGNKLNVNMIFGIKEVYGKINSKKSFEFNIDHVFYKLPYYVENKTLKNINTDLINSMNFFISIDQENDCETLSKVNLIELGIDYLLSIIFLLFGENKKSLEMLAAIENDIDPKNIMNNKIKYIKSNLSYRYIDAYTALFIEKSKERNYNYGCLKKYLNKVKYYADIEKHNMSDKRYNQILYVYFVNMSYIEYQNSKDVDKAIFYVHEAKKVNLTNDIVCLFNEAYLLAVNKEYSKAFNIYNRIKNRKIDVKMVNEISDFFSENIEKDIDYIANIFCECLFNLFFKDCNLAIRDFELLKKVDNKISSIIDTRTLIATEKYNNK